MLYNQHAVNKHHQYRVVYYFSPSWTVLSLHWHFLPKIKKSYSIHIHEFWNTASTLHCSTAVWCLVFFPSFYLRSKGLFSSLFKCNSRKNAWVSKVYRVSITDQCTVYLMDILQAWAELFVALSYTSSLLQVLLSYWLSTHTHLCTQLALPSAAPI